MFQVKFTILSCVGKYFWREELQGLSEPTSKIECKVKVYVLPCAENKLLLRFTDSDMSYADVQMR
jgi:hypothetical protein